MWWRVVEVTIGCWLAMSPFLFAHGPQQTALWMNDLLSAVAVATLALLSFHRRLRHAHSGNVLVGGWLVVFAFMNRTDPALPAVQNQLVVGCLLMLLAILPNEPDRPPQAWQ